jgi:hypothetical protein
MWYNAMKTNPYGFTSLGAAFLEALPMLAKSYVYKPGSSKKVPRLNENGVQVLNRLGNPVFDTKKVTECGEWKTKMDQLAHGIEVMRVNGTIPTNTRTCFYILSRPSCLTVTCWC